MSLLVWAEVWASGSSAVGIVTELVNVYSTLGVGVTALDVVGNSSEGGFESWVKVTIPVTVESPRRTATDYNVFPSTTRQSTRLVRA